jgi:uncharacterized protein (TIGR03437 family)
MGPPEGVEFHLEGGRLPTNLGGTRVLVNGEPVPLLYASHWQVNAIIPYSIPVGTRASVHVETGAGAGNEIGGLEVLPAGNSIFRLDDSTRRPAAALNQDGTVNSPMNPAKPGSYVALFGTGGGATLPPSVAGEVTPLELRFLENPPQVGILNGPLLTVEFAGAAPALVSGVTQINVKLPDVIPEIEGYPPGAVPLIVRTPDTSFFGGIVTLAVERN